jgi:hypothetical protein
VGKADGKAASLAFLEALFFYGLETCDHQFDKQGVARGHGAGRHDDCAENRRKNSRSFINPSQR